MKTPTLAAVLLALPLPAFAQAATRDTYEMSCSAFHHNADGSWNAVQPMTLMPAAGRVALRPKDRFKAGTTIAGFDLAAALDKSCAR